MSSEFLHHTKTCEQVIVKEVVWGMYVTNNYWRSGLDMVAKNGQLDKSS